MISCKIYHFGHPEPASLPAMTAGAEFHCPLPKRQVSPRISDYTTSLPGGPAALGAECSTSAASHPLLTLPGPPSPPLSAVGTSVHTPVSAAPVLLCPFGTSGCCCKKSLQVPLSPGSRVVWPHGSRGAFRPCWCSNPVQGVWAEGMMWSAPRHSPELKKGTQSRKNDPGICGL